MIREKGQRGTAGRETFRWIAFYKHRRGHGRAGMLSRPDTVIPGKGRR